MLNGAVGFAVGLLVGGALSYLFAKSVIAKVISELAALGGKLGKL